MKKYFVFLLLFAAIHRVSYSQENVDSVATSPFQLSFAYPLGTNGVAGLTTRNNVSINIITGLAGGVDGAEIGGVINLNRGSVHGFQIAGLFNGNNGSTKGLQCAGFANGANGNVVGWQVSGFANGAMSDLKGSQGAGFANIALGNVSGIQLSGFYNHAGKKMKGIQGAGFANYCGDTLSGSQAAGFCNLSTKKCNGSQVSGFANIALDNCSGMQIAGFSNIATDTIIGSQVSGFFNYAKHLKGFQIGIINISDTISAGIPIGLLTISPDGYFAFDIEANETMHVNCSYKMGVKKFYNIYSAHAAFHSQIIYWGMGYGFGIDWLTGPTFGLNTDLVCAAIHKNDQVFESLNLLNSLKLHASYKLSKTSKAFAGPVLHVQVYDDVETVLPYTLYQTETEKCDVGVSVGLSAGLRF